MTLSSTPSIGLTSFYLNRISSVGHEFVNKNRNEDYIMNYKLVAISRAHRYKPLSRWKPEEERIGQPREPAIVNERFFSSQTNNLLITAYAQVFDGLMSKVNQYERAYNQRLLSALSPAEPKRTLFRQKT